MRVEVAVFARAPRPGATKTRLIPALGAAGAAALYGAFLEDTLAKLEGLDARIWAASADDVEALSAHGLPVSLQPDADLGARMEAAMRAARGTHDAGLVIGTDAPTLPATRLREAIDALTRHDVVIGPSADGGYYLIVSRCASRTCAGRRRMPWPTRSRRSASAACGCSGLTTTSTRPRTSRSCGPTCG